MSFWRLNNRMTWKMVALSFLAAGLASCLFQFAARSRAANASSNKLVSKPAARSTTATSMPAAPAGSTYTWVGGTPGFATDWTVATNWSQQPGGSPRTLPDPADNLVFDGSGTSAPTITNIPTQTVATLSFTNGILATFNAASGGATLTINGGTGTDLSVPTGTSLTVATSNALGISILSGSKGAIGGGLIFQDGAHRLVAADVNGVTFQSGVTNGATFTTATGFSGNPFGSGTDGSVSFQGDPSPQKASSAFFNAGSDPFGGSGHSVTNFNLGSSQTFTAASPFSSDGRTYGNLTLDGNQSYAGSGTGLLTTFNTFTIATGSTLTLSNSAGSDLNLLGDIAVNGALTTNGRTVKFQGGNTTQNITTAATFGDLSIAKIGGSVKLGGTLTINGALQFDGTGSAVDVLDLNQNILNLNGTIGGTSSSTSNGFKGDATGATLNIGGTGALGTLKFVSGSQSLKSLSVNRTSSGTATLGSPLAVANTLTLTSGIVTTTSSNLLTVTNTAANAISGGASSSYINGPLTRVLPASLGTGSTYSFPVGKGTFNPFDMVSPTTNISATIQAEVFDANSGGTAGSGLSSLNTNRYWSATVTAGSFTGTTVRLTDSSVSSSSRIGKSSTVNGTYNSIGGTVSGSTISSNPITSFSFFNIGTISCPTSFTVNDNGDTSDASPGDGICADTNGKCTLRAAIDEANADSACGNLAINFAANLTAGGPATITLSSGALSIQNNLTITGPGASLLTISGNDTNSVFDVQSATVAILGLTVTRGNPSGIRNSFGTITLTNVSVTGNSGVGISNGADLTISASTVSGNNNVVSLLGGGIYNGGRLTVISSTISGNSAVQGGGIYNDHFANISATLINSTVSGNTAGTGGGIYNVRNLRLTNSTVSGNSSTGQGGGIYDHGVSTLTNVTITNNRSDSNNSGGEQGGGIFVAGTSPNLANTIVAGNFRTAGTTSDDISGVVSPASSFNLIGDGANMFGISNGDIHSNQVGSSSSPINALLALLANNGGPTMTHALLPGSPAINAGSNANLPADTFDLDGDSNTAEPLPVDQRGVGFVRVLNTTVDIGALESRGFTIATTSGSGQTATITTAFAAPLVATVSSAFGEPVAGGVVTFTAPASGASGTFTGGVTTMTVTTNSSGVATSPTFTANGTAGPYNVTASANGITGSPASFSLTNAQAPTSTSVASSVNPSDFGESVTFTATVTSAAGTPTGTVQFKDGGSAITCANAGGQTLSGGVATCQISTLSAGTHTITADYSGDANFVSSSGTLSGGQVVKAQPSLSINDVSVSEGDSGTKNFVFNVTLSAASHLQVTVNFATADGTAKTTDSDYQSNSGTLTFSAGDTTKTITVLVNGDQKFEPNETFFVNLSAAVNATISDNQGLGTILNDDAQGGIISFSQSNYNVNESDGFVTVTVNRAGDISSAATVDYTTDDTGAPGPCATFNGFASSRCDFTTALGTLKFGPNEGQKSFVVLVNRDGYVEMPSESFSVKLSNLTGGAVFGAPSNATVSILNSGSPTPNAIDDAGNFVRQHYHDFLNREPDQSGLDFWTNQITSCGSDAQCVEVRRINVSASFFLSIEFQQSGYLVERIYKVAFGDTTGTSTFGTNHQLAIPVVRFDEFLRGTQRIGQGVIVLAPGWEDLLESNKRAYALEFVQTTQFTNAFPTTMKPDEFVNKLNQNAGNVSSDSERNTAINLFAGASDTTNMTARAQALRQVAEDQDLVNSEFNRAFVLMQYYGYLRRNPNEAPESTLDYTGYDFWLTKLNQFNGNYINAEMVKAFLSSIEYRQRFGP